MRFHIFSLIPGSSVEKGSKVISAKAGKTTNIIIHKSERIKHIQETEGKCQEYAENDSKYKCILERFLKTMQNNESVTSDCHLLQVNVSKICWIPQMTNIMKFNVGNNCYSSVKLISHFK